MRPVTLSIGNVPMWLSTSINPLVRVLHLWSMIWPAAKSLVNSLHTSTIISATYDWSLVDWIYFNAATNVVSSLLDWDTELIAIADTLSPILISDWTGAVVYIIVVTSAMSISISWIMASASVLAALPLVVAPVLILLLGPLYFFTEALPL